MRKSYLAIMLVVALLIGAGSTYVVMQAVQPTVSSEENERSTNFADLPEDEQQAIISDAGDSATLSKVMQAYNVIQDNYLKEMDKDTLIEGAVQGMLETLEDPYSVYMDAETVEEFNQQIESSFEGIGAEVSMVEGKVTIIAPIKDSPAEEAGLKPNDQILKVNDESVEGLDLYEAVSKIRGEEGTTVTLEIERPGVSDHLTVDLVRDDIPLETVYSETTEVDGKKEGIIEITSFSEGTADRFKEELTSLEKQGIEGLVIDVRGNPGGLLTSVQDILKNFVTKDQPYMQIENGDGKKERYVSNLEQGKDYPITVLVNEGSASASEILAVSLKEAANAEVVGVTSYGKGTVQQTIPMGDGSTIKLTLYKWLSPKGNWIHEKGVKPTIEVEQPAYFYANPIQVEKSFTYNDSNDNIGNAQVMLEGLGYEPAREDGYFSKETQTAIKQFQSDNDLKANGELNKETAELIQTKVIEKIQKGKDDLQKQAALESLVD
ncbi:carboxy-terminal processing protease CtpB [Paraliobacillus ryukyuensis]|uniref:Carboxyl-terminal processing protease n=1 Tax=Paraliobacillus ryukyuensis TaxID=200904 RepID=A0A366E7B3_9BACI|nr:carboxyl-terminal processing protease [Paraliobacillus ryukyuensis]